jgi:triosephosphate isomerase (TIM)
MRSRLVAGNWKMNGSLAANLRLLESLKAGVHASADAQCAVCVPYPYLAQVQTALAGTSIAWGAQNVSEWPQGAFTGEVSGAMLRDFGCRHVLVGHSERRTLYGETDKQVAAKFQAAQGAGLIPILCVGESLQERESGVTEIVVGRQLAAVLDSSGVGALVSAVIAYEPVWAIGTGKTASPQQAQAVHAFIRSVIARLDAKLAAGLTIVYGGSVKGSNAKELFAMPDIDGGLVGGAALVAEDFVAICAAAGAA